MFGFLRLMLIALVGLTVIYVIVSIWSRQVRRGKLRDQWEEEGRPGEMEAFVRQGLEAYDGSFRRKLILLVYVVPLAVVGFIIYAVNYM